MKHIIFIIFTPILLYSCSTHRYVLGEFQGSYVQDEYKNISLVFNGSAFALIEKPSNNDLSLYVCCDTVTLGEWALDKSRGLIYLSSRDYLDAFLDIKVTESVYDLTDTIQFIIDNPIEQIYKKNKIEERDIYYKIAIHSSNKGFLSDFSTNNFNTNIITIIKPKGAIIDMFTISVYPKSNFSGRNIGTREATTIEYKIKQSKANKFEVYIPELTYGYLSYLRLNKDIVKIINRNKLEWDNRIYNK